MSGTYRYHVIKPFLVKLLFIRFLFVKSKSQKSFIMTKAAARSRNLIEINIESVKETATIHVLPCQVQHNGSAKISRFFRPSDACDDSSSGHCVISDSQNQSKTQEAYFRGRKLLGKEIKIPNGFLGEQMQA